MADAMKLRQQAERGDRARAILEDPLVVEAFNNLEQTIAKGWQDSLGDEATERERAYLMHRLLQNLRQHFTSLVTTGEAAKRGLMEIHDPKLRRIFRHG